MGEAVVFVVSRMHTVRWYPEDCVDLYKYIYKKQNTINMDSDGSEDLRVGWFFFFHLCG